MQNVDRDLQWKFALSHNASFTGHEELISAPVPTPVHPLAKSQNDVLTDANAGLIGDVTDDDGMFQSYTRVHMRCWCSIVVIVVVVLVVFVVLVLYCIVFVVVVASGVVIVIHE